ncbi:MAG: CHAT domain-containing protein [Kineosporiaceae bacterium]
MLGVVGSLVAGGSTGVVASVVPVADVQAEPLMAAMHRRLLGGASLARALADARRDLDRDGWGRDTRRTAEAFVALGA